MDSINNACKFGSDAWLELQAFKTRQLNRREKLNRHKNLNKDLIDGITSNHQPSTVGFATPSSSSLNNPTTISNNIINSLKVSNSLSNNPSTSKQTKLEVPLNHSNLEAKLNVRDTNLDLDDKEGHSERDLSPQKSINNNNIIGKFVPHVDAQPLVIQSCKDSIQAGVSLSSFEQNRNHHANLDLVECLLLLKLCDVALKLPIDSRGLQRSIAKIRGLETTSQPLIENLLQKFAHQELITVDEPATAILGRSKKPAVHHRGSSNANEDNLDDEAYIYVTSADHTKLVEFNKSFGSLDNIKALLVEPSKGDDLGDEYDLSNSTPINIRALLSTSSSERNRCSLDNLTDSKFHHSQAHQLDSNVHTEADEKSKSSIGAHIKNNNSISNIKKQSPGDDLESLLSLSSTKERESKKLGEELLELLSKPTAKERNLLERFRSADGYQVQEFCPKGTKGECNRNNKGAGACDKLHFKKIIAKHTEESLGDCSFLNTCFHMDSCKYVHYEVDYDQKQPKQQQLQFKRPADIPNKLRNTDISNAQQVKPITVNKNGSSNCDSATSRISTTSTICLPSTSDNPTNYTLSSEDQARIDAKNRKRFKTVLYPPQWIQCDLRFFDMSLLGKFSVVMADPPWDIHMELPYGTMSDDEMRKLNIPALQDEGVIFLWVTGRAMELGRECLALWGYERCDEIIWVKTNQLQRIIRTGRTGHWLNHGKEHCLVGVKGNPENINRGLDCDVIVAEVRATSHKPDEIYGIIERLSPGTRKIELFGRAHNVQPNWITLGNQLNGVRLIEPNLVNAFKKLNLPFQTVDNVT